MVTPNVLILAGDGINCEKETAYVFEKAGAKSTIVHINDVLEKPEGGFLFLAIPLLSYPSP